MRRPAASEARRPTRAGSCVATTKVARGRSSASSRSSSAAPSSSSALNGSSRTSSSGLVQQRAAEREPLGHPAGERVDALVARLPEPEALEQHADALTSLRDPVQPAVEVEVLERGQLAVDERFVAEEPDPVAGRRNVELAGGRDEQSRDQPEQRRLARAVRACERAGTSRGRRRGRGRGSRASSRSRARARVRGSLDQHVREDESRRRRR